MFCIHHLTILVWSHCGKQKGLNDGQCREYYCKSGFGLILEPQELLQVKNMEETRFNFNLKIRLHTRNFPYNIPI